MLREFSRVIKLPFHSGKGEGERETERERGPYNLFSQPTSRDVETSGVESGARAKEAGQTLAV